MVNNTNADFLWLALYITYLQQKKHKEALFGKPFSYMKFKQDHARNPQACLIL
jgi:hypothetical protein